MYEKTHDNLLDALMNLHELMGQDGTAVASGLHAYLKRYNVAYNHDTAKVLREMKIIGRHKDGTQKNPLIFWNIAKPPSSALVYEILAEVKNHRKAREEKAEKKRLAAEESLPPPLTELDILMNLRSENLETVTAINIELKKLKEQIKAHEIVSQMLSKKINSIQNPTK